MASQSYSLRLLIEGWNLFCARALLRMQINGTGLLGSLASESSA